MLHFPRETIIVIAIDKSAQIKLPVGLRSGGSCIFAGKLYQGGYIFTK